MVYVDLIEVIILFINVIVSEVLFKLFLLGFVLSRRDALDRFGNVC
jgi:hypothetical protein